MTRIGRYEILEELGRGGFATVYKARDSQLNRLVALKVLHESWSNDPEFVRRFRLEAVTVANLHHPHIVVVHDVGEIDRRLFIAMEFLPGEDLRRWLTRRNNPLAVSETLAILEPVAGALDYAHEKGVVHRDIKPGNIMIHEKGESREMVLTDFGLVKAMESSVALTSAGQILGSPEYMAPEQADPNRRDEIGPHTDNYSLGIVAYQMLAGRVPFPGNSISTLNAHINLPVPLPQEFNKDLSEGVTAVLLKMLAKDPANRYASATAFVDDLRKATRTDDQEELERLYAQLQEARNKRDWVEVVSLAARIETIQPGYRNVQQGQAEAHQQLSGPATASPTRAVEGTGKRSRENETRQGRGIRPVYILSIAGGLVMIGLLAGLVALITSLGNGLDEEQAGTATILALGENERATTSADILESTVIAAIEEATQTAMVTATPARDALETTATTVTEEEIVTVSPTRSTPPSNAALRETRTRPADDMVMVYVPAGNFMMGNDQGDADEQPEHEVSLDAFWIDQTEVTNAQYNRCVTDGECESSRYADNATFNGDDRPVVGVSWLNAKNYCAWAGAQLPTEAQWEYAARGEEGLIYPWGDELDCSRANVSEYWCEEYEYTAPVGSFPAGASWAGAYDMAGNVWEWVADWYDSEYYADAPPQNPPGPAPREVRVVRGGSWFDSPEDLRSSNRNDHYQPTGSDLIGFRCAAAGP